MHFHVTEFMVDDMPHELGGDQALTYPGRRPAFDTLDGAVDAVMGSAFESWGTRAETHVEVSLAVELSLGREHARAGAVAGWTESDDEGASWSVRACECTDGTLAQIFTTSPG